MKSSLINSIILFSEFSDKRPADIHKSDNYPMSDLNSRQISFYELIYSNKYYTLSPYRSSIPKTGENTPEFGIEIDAVEF